MFSEDLKKKNGDGYATKIKPWSAITTAEMYDTRRWRHSIQVANSTLKHTSVNITTAIAVTVHVV